MKRCKTCGNICRADVKECPECDGTVFDTFKIDNEKMPIYEVSVFRDIDALPGNKDYEKFQKWQVEVINKMTEYKEYFNNASVEVAKVEEDGLAISYGHVRITWKFPYDAWLLSFQLAQNLYPMLDTEFLQGCELEHFLNVYPEED